MIPAARRAALLLLLLAAAGARPAPLHAQRPLTLAVGGPQAQWRPVARLDGVLRDRGLRRALEDGLPLRFHFRVELWRKDLLDQLVGAHEVSRAVLRSPLDEGFVVEDGRTERIYPTLEAAEAALQAAFAAPLQPRVTGRYYYLARLDVESLSLSDLDELRRWLRGEARPAVQGRKPVERAVERGVRRFFVRILGLPTRRYEVRSRAFTL